MIARARTSTRVQKASKPVEIDADRPRIDEVGKDTSAQVPEPKGIEGMFPRGKESIEEAIGTGAENELEAPQDRGSTSRDPRGAIKIRDSSLFPSIYDSLIRDTQAMETLHGEGTHREEDLFRSLFARIEDVTGLGDLEVLKESSGDASSSFKLTDQFLAPSIYRWHKRTIVVSVLEDVCILGAPVGWPSTSEVWSQKRIEPRWTG